MKNNLYFFKFFLCSLILFICSCEEVTSPTDISERILFIRSSDNLYEICTMNPDGTDIRIITSHNTQGEFYRQGFYEARWSPDRSKIAICGGPNDQLEFIPIWIMDSQGNLKYRVTFNGANIEWSTNGDKILFAKRKDIYSILWDFYVFDINKRIDEKIMESDSVLWGLCDWSHDGKYILTSGVDDNSDSEILLYRIQDKRKTILTDNESPIHDQTPTWSPDESQIAYVSGTYRDGYQLMLMNADGSDKEVVVDTLARYGRPVWSPRGDEIIYVKSKKLENWYEYARGSDIYILYLNSRETNKLTFSGEDSVGYHVYDWK
jgi:Tol biopolymer transport system component